MKLKKCLSSQLLVDLTDCTLRENSCRIKTVGIKYEIKTKKLIIKTGKRIKKEVALKDYCIVQNDDEIW